MVRTPARLGYLPDTPPEPDRALLTRYAGGDSGAFAALLDRHGPLVLGACRRALGAGSAAADDAFQATFLVLARKAARLRDPDALPGWLFGVARRVASAARRRDARHDRAARAAARPEAAPPAGEWDDLLAVVDEEINQLPDDLRAAVLLCLYHGKTQDEAAAELGWSVSTLRRRLDRGRELLRSRLTTRGIAPAVALVAGAVAPSAVTAVPVGLRASALDLAAGGGVPADVAGLVRVALPRRSFAVVGLAAGSVVVAAGMVAVAAGWVGTPAAPPAPVADARPPEPTAPEVLAELPAAPLPPKAVVRLGTTRFRHGTDGAAGIVDPLGVTHLAFQPDGTLASVGTVRVRFWDTATGVERHAAGVGIPTPRWVIRATPFDAGRQLLLPVVAENGDLTAVAREWNLTDRTPGRTVTFARHPGRKGDVIFPTAVSADGKRFAQADGNADGWVWDADGKPLAKLAGKVRDFGVAAFLPGGAELVTTCPDGRFRVWDAATGAEVRAFGAYPQVWAAVASADGTRVAVVGRDGEFEDVVIHPEVTVWDTTRGAEVGRFPLPGLTGRAGGGGNLAFTPDGAHLVAAAHVGDRLLDVRWWALDRSAAGRWVVPSGGCNAHPLAAADGLAAVAIGSGDGTTRGVVRVFDGKTGREKLPPGGLSGQVRAVAFAAGGTEVVTTTKTGETVTWDATTGARLRTAAIAPPDAPDADVGFDVMAALGARNPFDTTNPRPGQPTLMVTARAVAPGGARVAVGVATWDPKQVIWGKVYVLDAKTRAVVWSAPIPDAAPLALAFRQDGSKLAVGSTVVRVFAAADGTAGPPLDGHRGAITALAFSPDGKRLASGSTDTTAVVWNVE